MWRNCSALAASLVLAWGIAAANHVVGSPKVGWIIDDQRQVVWVSVGTTLYHCNNLNGAAFLTVSRIIQSALPYMPNAVVLLSVERELERIVPGLCDRMGGRE